jgi:hypothetical protein
MPLGKTKVIVDVAALARILVPADRLSVTAEEIARPHTLHCQAVHGLGVRIDVKSIHRAIGLAHETCLARILSKDDGRAFRHRLEDIGGADLNAEIAVRAGVFIQNLDHYSAASL